MTDQEIQHIGTFQFENLVKNRIPFLLVHFHQDFSEVFNGFYANYAKSQGVDASFIEKLPESTLHRLKQMAFPESISVNAFQEIENKLQERGLMKESALVFLCENGKKSHNLFQMFWKHGYGNSYWVKGGMQALRQDFKA